MGCNTSDNSGGIKTHVSIMGVDVGELVELALFGPRLTCIHHQRQSQNELIDVTFMMNWNENIDQKILRK